MSKINFDTQFLKTIIKQFSPEAVLLFGSQTTGEHWEQSDIDIFLIVKSFKEEHSSFYMENNQILYHFNIVSSKKFTEYLHSPTKRVIHGVLVNSHIIHNNTNWLIKERNRLKRYPKRNHLLQMIQLLEELNELIYQINKAIFLKKTIFEKSLKIQLYEKYMQMILMKRKVYFSRDFVQMLSSQEKISLQKWLDKQNEQMYKKIVNKIERESILVLKEFLSIVPKNTTFNYVDVFKLYQISLHRIIDFAVEKNLLQKTTRNSTFASKKISELCFKRK